MRSNDDGQGVLDGVPTQTDERKQAFKDESKIINALFTDTGYSDC